MKNLKTLQKHCLLAEKRCGLMVEYILKGTGNDLGGPSVEEILSVFSSIQKRVFDQFRKYDWDDTPRDGFDKVFPYQTDSEFLYSSPGMVTFERKIEPHFGYCAFQLERPKRYVILDGRWGVFNNGNCWVQSRKRFRIVFSFER